MLKHLGTLCCIVYYITASITEIPSILRVIKRKKSEDYSVIAIILDLVSAISWSIYIYVSEQNIIVYIGTFIDLMICILYASVILKYHENNKAR